MRLRAPVTPTVERTPDAALLAPDLWPLADVSHNEWRNWPRVFDGWLNNVLYWELTRTRLPALLRYEDRLSMAHSIESRVPFLDHRLVELAFALPDDVKRHGGWSKYALRRALDGLLPDSRRLAARQEGLSDAGRQLAARRAWRGRLDVLRDPSRRSRHLFPEAALEPTIAAHVGGPGRSILAVVASAEHRALARGVRCREDRSRSRTTRWPRRTGAASRRWRAVPERRAQPAHPALVARGRAAHRRSPRDAPWRVGRTLVHRQRDPPRLSERLARVGAARTPDVIDCSKSRSAWSRCKRCSRATCSRRGRALVFYSAVNVDRAPGARRIAGSSGSSCAAPTARTRQTPTCRAILRAQRHARRRRRSFRWAWMSQRFADGRADGYRIFRARASASSAAWSP